MNPKDRMAMMIAGMDGTPDRKTPMPTEGDNYGYASSTPSAFNSYGEAAYHAAPAAGPTIAGFGLMARGIMRFAGKPLFKKFGQDQKVLNDLGIGTALVGGAEAINKTDEQVARAMRHLTGEHSHQPEMDEGLNAMRYYGHDNLRGPR